MRQFFWIFILIGLGGCDSDDDTSACDTNRDCVGAQICNFGACILVEGSDAGGSQHGGGGEREDEDPLEGGDPACQQHTDCPAGQICDAHACANMFNRQYHLTVNSAVISERKPDGTTWDAFGGLPDPYVSVRVDDDSKYITASRRDTRRPTWNESVNIQLFSSSDFILRLYDEDLQNNDHIGDIRFDLEQAIKDGGYSGGTTGSVVEEIVFTITPR